MLSDHVLLSIPIFLIAACYAAATAASSPISVSKPSINQSPRSLIIQSLDLKLLEEPEALTSSSSTPFRTDQNHHISLVAWSYTGDNPSGYTNPTVFFDTETYFYYSSLGVRSSTLAAYTTDTFLFESDSRYDFTGQSYPTTAVYCFDIDANCVTLVNESGTTTRAVVPVTKTSLSVWASAGSLITMGATTAPETEIFTLPATSLVVDTSELLSSVTAGATINISITSTQKLPITVVTETLTLKSTLLTNTPLPRVSLSPLIKTNTTVSPHTSTTHLSETASIITSILAATPPIRSTSSATPTTPMSTAMQSSTQQTAGGIGKHKPADDRQWAWGAVTLVLMGIVPHFWI
ncbi:hypothetical protein MMC14_010763 [Varicellaria rhodocarpa]|nr:hypothetical protein [Varicellaria rhodocarpa]